jgi:hypothetical protein
MGYMEEAGTRINIVVLDACRNNPFARSFRSSSRGLVVMESGAKGTFVAYATAPGSVAFDGDGRNGLYTKHLLRSLKHPDSDIERVFKRVRSSVARRRRTPRFRGTLPRCWEISASGRRRPGGRPPARRRHRLSSRRGSEAAEGGTMRATLRASVAALAVAPAFAFAQDNLSFSAAVDLNYKRLDQSTVFVNTTTGVGTVNEFNPEIWTLNVSPSLSWKGVFLTAAIERTLGEGSVSEPTSGGWNDRRYSRDENSITLGYAWRGFAVFVGYLDNTTTTTSPDLQRGRGVAKHDEVTEQGPYLGVGYSYRFSSGGSIAASIAVTRADGSSQTRNSNAS